MKSLSILLVALFAMGCPTKTTDTAAASRIETILALSGDAKTGAPLYASDCAACHGADGAGSSGPALTKVVPGAADADLVDVIINGSGTMPASTRGDQEVADILAFLKATF